MSSKRREGRKKPLCIFIFLFVFLGEIGRRIATGEGMDRFRSRLAPTPRGIYTCPSFVGGRRRWRDDGRGENPAQTGQYGRNRVGGRRRSRQSQSASIRLGRGSCPVATPQRSFPTAHAEVPIRCQSSAHLRRPEPCRHQSRFSPGRLF